MEYDLEKLLDLPEDERVEAFAWALGQLISVTRPVETVGCNITSECPPGFRSVKTQSYSVPLLDSTALLSTPHSSLVLLPPPPKERMFVMTVSL